MTTGPGTSAVGLVGVADAWSDAAPSPTSLIAFTVKSKNDALPDMPTAGAQKATRSGPDTIELDVDVKRTSPASKDEFEDTKYRASTQLIDFDTKEGREVLAKIGPRNEHQAPLDRADELRRAVHSWISNKDFASALASASEAARCWTC